MSLVATTWRACLVAIVFLVPFGCGEFQKQKKSDTAEENASDPVGEDHGDGGTSECDLAVKYICITKTTDSEGTVHFFSQVQPQMQMSLQFNVTKMDNYTGSHPLPLVMTVKNPEKVEFFSLKVKDNSRARTYTWTHRTRTGAYNPSHSGVTYLLPFAPSQKYFVGQGYNGNFSHTGQLKYSLDFSMREGEAVHAARGGVVFDFMATNTENGPTKEFSDKANYISILHDDGTVAQYLHLQHQGVKVEKWQKVEAGQLIGRSGNTGWSTGPHLHFHVMMTNSDFERETIPTQFKTKTKPLAQLDEGETYEAVAIGGHAPESRHFR